MHSAMMPRWQRHPPRPCTGYTGHWRAEGTPLVTSSATHLPHSPQPAPEISGCNASPRSAPHRHAVDRAGVVGAGRVRQLGESSHASTLAHVAACHGQPRPSRLGGGGDASPAKAEVRGGGHERAVGGQCAAGSVQETWRAVRSPPLWSRGARGGAAGPPERRALQRRRSVQIAHCGSPRF